MTSTFIASTIRSGFFFGFKVIFIYPSNDNPNKQRKNNYFLPHGIDSLA
jgi:hypothetical protein